jgi:hypothetical protein
MLFGGFILMATLLGGSRWDDEITPLDDDWEAWKAEQDNIYNNPLSDDYIPEKYRTNKEGYNTNE